MANPPKPLDSSPPHRHIFFPSELIDGVFATPGVSYSRIPDNFSDSLYVIYLRTTVRTTRPVLM